MPRNASSSVDARTVLKTYNISSVNPKRWQDTSVQRPKPRSGNNRRQNRYSVLQDQRLDFDEEASRSQEIVEDEQDPLGISRDGVFSALREKAIPIDASPALAQPYLLASKNFSPTDFLATVHSSSTYPVLASGLENLQESIQQESGALKQLVVGDFDRFVRCKNGIDEVYERMVEGGFDSKEDYGTLKIKKALDDSTAKAQELYNPVLDSRAKAERLRATLIILGRHKEYFNLPSLIANDIKTGDSTQLLASYNRAQALHAEYTGSTPLTSVPPSATTAMANRRVFDKVWEEVQRLVAGYRFTLTRKLKDTKGFGNGGPTIDSMLDGIDLLISLDEPIHPLPTLIHHHCAIIMSSALSLTERHSTQIEILRRKIAAAPGPTASVRRVTFLQGIAKATDSPEKDSKTDLDDRSRRGWDTDPVEDMWAAVLTYVREMGSLLNDLAGLKDTLDRAADKAALTSSTQKLALTQQHQSQIRTQLNNTLNALLNHLTIFFTNPPPKDLLSHLMSPNPNTATHSAPSTPVTEYPSQFEDIVEYSFLPRYSSALAACKWGLMILDTIGKRVVEFVSWGEETGDAVRIAVGGVRERLIRAALVAWRDDAEHFYVLEDWVIDKTRGNGVTGWVGGCHGYQRQVIQGLETLVNFGSNYDAGRRIVGKIRGGVVGECKKEFETGIFATLESSIKLAKGTVESPARSVAVEQDVRLLLCISNLSELKGSAIPKIVNLFENAFELSFTDNLKGIMEIANTIDEKLFADYTRRRAKMIKEIVKKGILEGIDWSTLKQPFDVQPYVHQALLSLVTTHSQVTSTSPTILPRVMTSLVESFSSDLLASFRKVPSFCMGGMLQATLEVEFLHQTLGSNVSKQAGETLQAVYGTIEKAYAGSGGVDLELGKVKGLLQRSRAGTKYVYSCFRTKKNGKSDGSSSSRAASVRSK